MKPILRSVAAKAVYFFAACVLLAALLVTSSRLITPLLDTHKLEIESWASRLLGMRVTINHAEISWFGYQPVIKLDAVTLYNIENNQPALQIKKVRIACSIPRSLWQWQLVPNRILISGSGINVYQTASGEINVQGFPTFKSNSQPLPAETNVKEILGWLSVQSRITLQDIDLHYIGINKQKYFVTINDLDLHNSGVRHFLAGKGVLHQQIATEVTAAMQWQGMTFDLNHIQANIYFYVTGLSFMQWLQGLDYKSWEVRAGIGSTKIWADFRNGSFQKIQTIFAVQGLNLYSQRDKASHIVDRLSGNIGWINNDNEQIIAGEDILIDFPDHLWPVTSFYTVLSKTNNQLSPKLINIGYLNLQDTVKWLITSPSIVPLVVFDQIKNLQPAGTLRNLVLNFLSQPLNWQNISVSTEFGQLKLQQWQEYPGIQNLSGALEWDWKAGGEVKLNSKRIILNYPKFFQNKILMDLLSGTIRVKYSSENDAWDVGLVDLRASNSDLAANLNGQLLVDKESSRADLQGHFTMQRADNITRYLPLKVFASALVSWLKQALSGGEIKNANVILRGQLNEFPFRSKAGKFLVTADVEKINLKFAPDWPALQNMDGKLSFIGSSLIIDIQQSDILGILLTNIHGEIADLGGDSPELSITSAPLKLDAAQMLAFIQHTPLENTIGKNFSNLQLTGPINLQLKLMTPLTNPNQTHVIGSIILENDFMTLIPWNLAVTDLLGKINFTENSAQSQKVIGRFFDRPITISLTTVRNPNEKPFIRAIAKNNLNIKDLENWLHMTFKTIEGSADVTAAIDIQESPKINLQSNLVGITLNLPEEFAKRPDQIKTLNADIYITYPELRIKADYDRNFHVASIFNKQNKILKLTGLSINFGMEPVSWPEEKGLFISGDFKTLSWDRVKSYYSESDNKLIDLPSLREVNINAENLLVAGQHITQAMISAIPSNDNWNLKVRSNEAVGALVIPKNFSNEESLSANFARLHLHNVGGDQGASLKTSPSSLPAISLQITQLIFDNIMLGQISLKTLPVANGLRIQVLRILSALFDLSAIGDWIGGNTTHLKGVATSQSVSGFLSSFGYDVHNFIAGQGRLNFNLGWHGIPFSPNLKSLTGSATLDIGSGRIIDIGQESETKMDIGRMISILSLRRLSLNFSDVFKKGYSFDYIRGNFIFKNGDAYTSDLRLDGPVARVSIEGRIGLLKKDFDLRLSVTSHVTASIPVAATLLTVQPLIGLAALAVNAVIGPQVSKAVATYTYQVSGSWSNPTWAPLNK